MILCGIYLSLSDLLHLIMSSCTYVVEHGIISFFVMAESYSTVYTCHIFFIDLSVDGHLGCFHVLTIVNVFGCYEHRGAYIILNYSLGYIPRCGIGGSYGNSVFSLLLLLLSRFSRVRLCATP